MREWRAAAGTRTTRAALEVGGSAATQPHLLLTWNGNTGRARSLEWFGTAAGNQLCTFEEIKHPLIIGYKGISWNSPKHTDRSTWYYIVHLQNSLVSAAGLLSWPWHVRPFINSIPSRMTSAHHMHTPSEDKWAPGVFQRLEGWAAADTPDNQSGFGVSSCGKIAHPVSLGIRCWHCASTVKHCWDISDYSWLVTLLRLGTRENAIFKNFGQKE